MDNALMQIPGLAGYLGAQQNNQQNFANQIQTATQLQTLKSHYDQQDEMKKVREIISTEKDPEKVIPALMQLGPTGATMAKHYADAMKASQDIAIQRSFTGGGDASNMRDPDFLRRMGLATKRPELITHAERIERLRENGATLDTMRSRPQDMPAGTPVDGTTMETAQPIPAAERPAFDRVAAASAAGQTMTSGPQPGDQAPTAGGLFDTLTKSPVPQIATQARVLQGRLEQSGNSIPAQHWQDLQARLAAQEATYLNRPEPLVSTVGPDGKPVLTPRGQAAGMRPGSNAELPALPQGQLTSAAAQVATGMPVTQVVPGYGRNISDRREAVRNEAIAQIKAQHPGMDDAQAGQELANRTIDFAAGKRSIGQLNTMLGATRQAVDQLDFNVKKVTAAMDKLPSSDLSPVINAIARGYSKWTGDPAYSELFYYMHAAAMESARILQGGQASVAQLHQGAADEAKQWADANYTTPKAWKEGVAPAMTAEGAERIKTYERAIAKQRPGADRATPEAPGNPAPAAPTAYPTATSPNGRKVIFKDGKWQAPQ